MMERSKTFSQFEAVSTGKKALVMAEETKVCAILKLRKTNQIAKWFYNNVRPNISD